MDDFEKRIQRQPSRKIPREWRADILATAADATVSPCSRHTFLSTMNARLSALIWPSPQAWAGLAAAWILIFALRFSTHDKARAAGNKSSVSPEVIAELRQQRLLFAELVGAVQLRDVEPPKRFSPRPHGERRHEILAA